MLYFKEEGVLFEKTFEIEMVQHKQKEFISSPLFFKFFKGRVVESLKELFLKKNGTLFSYPKNAFPVKRYKVKNETDLP
jgi:hypothetical protein